MLVGYHANMSFVDSAGYRSLRLLRFPFVLLGWVPEDRLKQCGLSILP